MCFTPTASLRDLDEFNAALLQQPLGVVGDVAQRLVESLSHLPRACRAFVVGGEQRFIGGALDANPLHRQADDLGALNVMFYDHGDALGWHFDNADFAVTLMLQAPVGGGVFEYVPTLRTAEDQNPSGVAALLGGDRTSVRSLSPEPGTLSLFRGHLSPHRVTPVAGDIPRINAVLSYARQPDAQLTPSARRIFFGR